MPITAATGPVCSPWYCDQLGMGHTLEWQDQQLAAGMPIEPSVRDMPPPLSGEVSRLNTIDKPFLERLNGRNIAFRTNNITGDMIARLPAVTVTLENWRSSYLCVRQLADGSVGLTPLSAFSGDARHTSFVPSPFAGTAAWTQHGDIWARRPYVAGLQAILHSPAGVIIRENNEGPRVRFANLYVKKNVRHKNHNGVMVWSDSTTPVATYTAETSDPPGSTPGIVYRVEGQNIAAYYWRSDAELDAMDLRAKEWVGPRRGSFPPDSLADFTALERAQYQATYAGFEAASVPGWRGKIRTVGYGGVDENRQNDAASYFFYVGFYRNPILTTPGVYTVDRWDAGKEELAMEQANPKSWREYSICIGNPASGIYAGLSAGKHAIIDPESYAGLISHLVWRMQAPGKEVRLAPWDNAATKPTHLLFATGTNQTTLKSDCVAALSALGRADALAWTINDFNQKLFSELKRIHVDPIINEYWRRGTTKLLSSPLNTPTGTKVYATETAIPGVSETLLFVYTPCDLTEAIQVGTHVVRPQRTCYLLTGAGVEIK